MCRGRENFECRMCWIEWNYGWRRSNDGTSIKSVKEGFLVVDILRESVDRLSRYNDLARMGSRDSKDRRGEGGSVVREVPAGAAQHAHEVAVSRSYGSARLRRRRRRGGGRRRRRRLGTCLTKHSCGRYLVHATARTDERGPLGTERCAQNTGHSSACRGTGIGEENSDAATRVGALPACQCTNHSPFTPFSATLV